MQRAEKIHRTKTNAKPVGAQSSSSSSGSGADRLRVRVSDFLETGAEVSKNGFTYSGKDSKGNPIKKYYIDVPTEKDAARVLKAAGIELESLTPRKISSRRRGRIKDQELIDFAEGFGEQIEAGVPIRQILKNLAPVQMNQTMADALLAAEAFVFQGKTLYEAFAAQKDSKGKPLFPVTLNFAFRLGENVGSAKNLETGKSESSLKTTLYQFAEGVRKDKYFRDEFIGAMKYPLGIGGAAIVAVGIFLVKILPSFTDFFKAMGNGKEAQLPFTTQTLVTLSDFLQSWLGIGSVLAAVAVIVWTIKYLRSPVGQVKFAYVVLHLPFFGMFFRAKNAAKTARALSLLSAGLSNVALWFKYSAESSTNAAYRDMLENIENIFAQRGIKPLTEMFKPYPFLMGDNFMGVLVNFDQSGDMQLQCHRYAKFMETIADKELKKLLSVLQKVSYGFAALLVLFLLLAFYEPIFNSVQTVLNK